MYKVRNIYTPKQEAEPKINISFKGLFIVFVVFAVVLYIIPYLIGAE